MRERDSQTDCGTSQAESHSLSLMESGDINDYSSGEKCNGVMGVPITFLDKHNPSQFEIVGITTTVEDGMTIKKRYCNATQHNKNGSTTNGSKVNTRSTILRDAPPVGKIYYTAEDVEGYLEAQYPRVLIRYKRSGEGNL